MLELYAKILIIKELLPFILIAIALITIFVVEFLKYLSWRFKR